MSWAMRTVLRTVVFAWVIALCVACDPPAPHGHAGIFAVQGTMMVNSCGPQSVPAASHLMFTAQLGYSSGQASWQVSQNGASATGAWTDVPPSFRFTADSYVTLRAAIRAYGIPACVIHRADVIDGTLTGTLPDLAALAAFDGGPMFDAASQLVPDDASITTFAATETIAFAVADGADCRDQIGVGQGQFLTLPCQITYVMDATMTGVPSVLR